MGWLTDIFTRGGNKENNIQERGLSSYPGGDIAYNILSDSTQLNKETEVSK